MTAYEDTSEKQTDRGGRTLWPPYHWLESPEIKPIVDDFWNPRFDKHDAMMYNRFLNILKLSKSGLNGDEIGRALQMNNVRKYLTGRKMSFLTHLRAQHDALGHPTDTHKWLPTRLRPRGTPSNAWIQVPDIPITFDGIDKLIRVLPKSDMHISLLNDFDFKSTEELNRERTNLFGFLLGAIVGDFAKYITGLKRFT
ncbi:MAG: hypothetical protein OK452_09865, partial [Thaumarchaeota archaeon]|nr:hypothetical protein [Nitrososphaerota archaeon]